MTSQKCNCICHEDCGYGPGESKEHWCVMTNGYCTEFPGKSHYTIHANLPILLVTEEKEDAVTDKDLEKRYYESKS